MDDIRLIGGSTLSSGRLEILFNNRWTAICNTDWDDRDASVVCKSMGFISGRAVSNGAFTQTKSEIKLTGFQCNGHEKALTDCPFTYGPNNCTHQQDAAITCLKGVSEGNVIMGVFLTGYLWLFNKVVIYNVYMYLIISFFLFKVL